jgi:hypothetical protein
MIILAVLVACAAAFVVMYVSRDSISRKVYERTGERLAGRMTPEQREKYGADLTYTLDTFWKFRERGLISQNDLADVMDKMKRLAGKDRLEDMEIFDFIGYVSRIYTEVIRKNREKLEREGQ